jgi:hypothetical protein
MKTFSLREKVAEGRMRDFQGLNIPHPPLRGTLSRRERDSRIDYSAAKLSTGLTRPINERPTIMAIGIRRLIPMNTGV